MAMPQEPALVKKKQLHQIWRTYFKSFT